MMNEEEMKKVKARYEGKVTFRRTFSHYGEDELDHIYVMEPRLDPKLRHDLDPKFKELAKTHLSQAFSKERWYEEQGVHNLSFKEVTEIVDKVLAWIEAPPPQITIALEIGALIVAHKIKLILHNPADVTLDIFKEKASNRDLAIHITDTIWVSESSVSNIEFNLGDPAVFEKVAEYVNERVQRRIHIKKIRKSFIKASVHKLQAMADIAIEAEENG